MAIERKHVNKRMSQAVVHNGVIYLAGQVALNAAGAPVAEQTQDILNRIDTLLGECGSSKENILTASIWLTDMRTFDEMNAVWDAWVPANQAPARACVESRLARTDFTVEIMVTAAQ